MNKLILGGVGVVLVGMGLMSSFYKVNPGEHAIVLTMGRYSGDPVKEEGLKFNWPFGIDQVHITILAAPTMKGGIGDVVFSTNGIDGVVTTGLP